MFERYTERARRVIFFSRHEASQFGSTTIETHHLLLGLLREDKNLTTRLMKNSVSVESLLQEIHSKVQKSERTPEILDLPLSNECKRILAYANEEAERLAHRHIGTEHLLLGILREKDCLAADILTGRGLNLEALRGKLAREPRTKSLHLNSDTLVGTLEKHNFVVPRQHLVQALAAEAQGVTAEAQRELLLFIETLAVAVAQGTSVDDVLLAVRGFRSGLPDEEDWEYRFQLTLLLAELLVARYERRTKT